MAKNTLITPKGTKDYLFEEVLIRKKVNNLLTDLFNIRGFHQVETTGLEFFDVYNVGEGSIQPEIMFKLVDNMGRLMVVRPDSTMPIARLLSTRLKSKPLPLRLFYIQPIYRNQKEMRGMQDEILQAGIELIAKNSIACDLEVLTLALSTMKNLVPNNYNIELGHIGIFNSLIKELNLNNEKQEEVRLLIEAKNYSVLNDLLDTFGDNDFVTALKKLPSLFGDHNVFNKARNILKGEAIEILNYLENIYNALKEIDPQNNIRVDLGIVNRIDYYTGLVFKGYIEGTAESILSGGRYDNVLREFSYDSDAIGFAVNINATAKYLFKKENIVISPPKSLIYITDGYLIKGMKYFEEYCINNKCQLALQENLEDAKSYAIENNINNIIVISDTITVLEV